MAARPHPIRMRASALVAAALFIAAPSLRGDDIMVRNAEQLRSELRRAQPGTTISLAPGRYSPGIHIEKLRGTKDKPIVIAAADERDPPVFADGKVGFHFSACSYVTLRGVKVSGCTGNGINADDGGNPEEPSQGMVFENITIEDIGPKGNRDALKLSGLDNFAVRGCTFSGWGGSAIDMVGCHDGVVENCRFVGKSGFSQDHGVQTKGASERIAIRRNFFKQGGGRAVNLGGSTGLPYFRPKVRDYEAKDIEVAGNHFVGSLAPVVYASSIECTVRHNTIVNPEKWVLRILQEQPTDKFLPCQKGVFEANLIVFDRRVQVFANVGPNTKSRDVHVCRQCLVLHRRRPPAVAARARDRRHLSGRSAAGERRGAGAEGRLEGRAPAEGRRTCL